MSGRYYDRDEQRYHNRAGVMPEDFFGREEKHYRGRESRGDEDEEYSGRGYGGRGRGSERDFLERAGDEVRSWFGDEEAERRRRMDEQRGRQYYGREGARYGGRGDDREDYYDRSYGEPSQSGYAAGRYEERGGYGRERDYGERGYGREGGSGSSYLSSYGAEHVRRRSGRAFRAGRDSERESPYGGEEDSGRRGYSGGGNYGRSRGTSGRSYTKVWMTRGPHTGRGPRNYRRSDERITEEVNERLTQHGQLDAEGIEITVQDGEVTLKGTVESRWAKRAAEDTAESVSGVKEVHNQLRVRQNAQDARSQEGQETRQGDGEQQGEGAGAKSASA